MTKILPFLVFILLLGSLNAQTFNGNSGTSIGSIPDNSSKCFPLSVSGLTSNLDSNFGLASVSINIQHSYDADLIVKLQSPDGTEITLTNQNGSSGKNYTNTVFTSTASNSINSGVAPFTGTYVPQGSLGAFNTNFIGNGTWQLCVTDNATGSTGKVLGWSLTFNNTPALAPPPIPACSSSGLATNLCANAPMVCNFDGLCGNTSGAFKPYQWTELTNAFCGRIDNNSFIKFIASATSASFDVWVYNSKTGDGIQTFFFDGGCGSGAVNGYGCTYILLPSAYPNVVMAKGLTVGNTYYLMIDGAAGDVCDYTVKPISGVNVINVNVNPDTKNVCQGTNVNLTASGGKGQTYSWTSTTAAASLPTPATGATIAVNSSILTTGSYDYTVKGEAIGGCPATKTITLNIVATPVISVQPTPASQTLSINGTATTLNVASSTTGVSYQWYVSSSSATSGFVPISGATTTSYTPPTDVAGTFYYYCAVSNGGCITPSNTVKVIINDVPGCTTPDALAFVTQPTTTEQGKAMNPSVTVKIYCTALGSTAKLYTGAVTLTAKDGCGFVSQTVNAVAGIATFSNIIFTRSVQDGVSLVATAAGISGSVTSATFSITTPTSGGGGKQTVQIKNENFKNYKTTPNWHFSVNPAAGTNDDSVGVVKYYYDSSCLVKTCLSDNTSGANESKSNIYFDNVTGLGKYQNLSFSFKIAALNKDGEALKTTTKGVSNGDGMDKGDSLYVYVSFDKGSTWNSILEYDGSGAGDEFLKFTDGTLVSLNTSSATSLTFKKGDYNSAFKLDITPGTTDFMVKFRAIDNRKSEHWAISNLILIGDTTITSAANPSPLPTVIAIGDTSVCGGTSANLSSTISNASLPIKSYSWTTATNLKDATIANPVTVTTLNEGQSYNYTLTITDADGCKGISNPVTVNILRLPTLLSQTTNAETVCKGVKLSQMSVTGLHTESYQWYQNTTNSTVGGTAIKDSVYATFTPSSSVAGTYYYYCVLGGACSPSVTSAISGAIVINALPSSPIVSVVNPTCTTATGSVTVASSTTGLTFSTDGSTYSSYSTPYILAAGSTYSITAKNSNGCLSQATSGTIGAQPANISTPTVSVVNPTCTTATGSVSITSTTTGLSFSTDGSSYIAYTSPFTVASGATYSITAKNSDGCVSTPVTGTMATQPATPAIPTVSITNPTCATATGSIKITSSTTGLTFSTDGTTYATYSTPYVVAAGTAYSITAKNLDGCISTATTGTMAAQPATPSAPTVTVVNPTCSTSTGSVTITSSTTGLTFSTNGTTYANYSSPYVVNANGSYSITAKSLDGCISTATTGTLSAQPATPAKPTVSITNPTCTNTSGSVAVSSTTSGLTFSTDGSTYTAYSTPFTVASGASYSITAKNADGCVSAAITGTMAIQPATPVAPTLTITNPTCTKATGTVAITSTTSGLTFSTDGSSYSSYSIPYVVAAGASYNITAKNADGCISSAATGSLIAQPATPAVPTVSVTSPTCTDANGYITITSSTTGLTFSLDAVTYTSYSNPLVVAAGASYSITTKNSDGCISSPAKGIIAKQLAIPAAPIVSVTNPTCTTVTGSIKITSSTTGLSFSTDGTTYTSYATPYIIAAGTAYSITAKNVDGCISTAATGTIVAQPATPVVPTVNAVNPTCTNPKGSVEITSATNGLTFSTNGVSYASYSTPYIVNANGSYSITAKNTDGCVSAATTGTLSAQPATPTKPTVTITKPTCTDANGSVAVSSTTLGLTFSSDGNTYAAYSTPFTVASGATYSLTAKNTDGCISAAVTGTMAIQPATPAAPTLTITNPTCTKATGTVAITSTTTGLTFSTNAVNYANYTTPYTVAGGASYSITARNAQGCISLAATGYLIAQPATPAVPTVAVTSPTCTDANGYIAITSTATGLTFSSDAVTYTSYSNPLVVVAGTSYSITAKNADGCISSPAKGIIAKQPATPSAPSVVVTNPTCTNASGAIKIASSTNGLTFSADAATYASYTTPYVVPAGSSYSITSKSINGCISAATTGKINAQPATPATPTVTVTNPTCTNAKGAVEITSSTTGLTFSTNGITYATYSTPYVVNANGSYSISAKNSDGCISSAIAGKIGAQPATPATPKVVVTNPTCTTATGSVKITSNTTGLTFSTDGTNYDVYSTPYTIAASANYSITAKNVDGCISAPASGTLIAQPATPSAPSITVTDPSCSSANGIVAITSTTTGLTFSTNGKNYASYTNPYLVAAGTNYSITAKNADGCISTATTGTIIAQPTPPKAFTVIGGGSYCPGIDGLAIALNNSETGVYYQLQIDGVNTGSLISGTGTALSFPKQSAIGVYTVAATYATSGCTNNMKGSATIVNGVPKVLSVTITPSTTTPCLGNLVTVAAKPTNAGKDASYEWKINDSIVQTGTSTTYSTKLLKDKDTVSCLLTSHIGCLVSDSGYSAKIAFTVSTLPTVDSIKSATIDTVCQNANITLTSKTLNGVWSSDKSYIATVDKTTGVVTGVAGGIDSIKYTVSNKCGSVYTKFGVHVINLSRLAPIEGDSIICKGTEIRLYNNLSGGVWSVDNRSIDTVASNGKVAGLQLGKDSVSYTYAGYCNTVTTKHGIKVIGKPLDSKDITIYPPKCLSPFSGSLDLNITGTESPYTYTFNGSTFPVTTSASGIGEGTYYLYFYNYAGCLIDSFPHVQFSSEGCDSLYVPTGFRPGSSIVSGKNNLLKPFGGSITTVSSLQFRVFNRFGNLLFVSNDLYNGWDGSFKGIMQEPGTYVWYLDYTLTKGDKKISLKGTSVLIR